MVVHLPVKQTREAAQRVQFSPSDFTGYSTIGLARLLWEQKVLGSSPSTPIYRDIRQLEDRHVWNMEAVRSSRAIPMRKQKLILYKIFEAELTGPARHQGGISRVEDREHRTPSMERKGLSQ